MEWRVSNVDSRHGPRKRISPSFLEIEKINVCKSNSVTLCMRDVVPHLPRVSCALLILPNGGCLSQRNVKNNLHKAALTQRHLRMHGKVN